MTLSACDSEVLKSDARMGNQPCKGCHAQMDPYARVLLNFGPIGDYRTIDEGGHPIDPTVTFVPNSPLAPGMATGAQDVRARAGSKRRAAWVLGAEGGQLRARRHDPDLQHLRAQRYPRANGRHHRVVVQDASPPLNSCAPAPEVRSDVLQVQAKILPAGVRRLGRPAGAAAALDRGAGTGGEGAAAPADPAPPAGGGAQPDVLAPERQRDHDELHAALRDRALRDRRRSSPT